VDLLDTREIKSQYDLKAEQGREPLHSKTLLKVGLYALHNCWFSLRKMKAGTQIHLGYKWLTGDRVIDHSTLGYFYRRFREQIVKLFARVVKLCVEQGLVDFEILAIDSVNLRANASYKQSKDLEGVEKEEQKVQQRLWELLSRADQEEGSGSQKAEGLARRKEKLEEAKGILEARIRQEGKEQKINLTDFDAHIMEQANGERNPAYSVTTSTDTAHDIVTHFQVNGQDNDAEALRRAVEGSRETTRASHKVVEADAGFASRDNRR